MHRSIPLLLILLNASVILAQTEEGLQELNGTMLYVKTVGEGAPIVVIHGGPGLNHTYFIPHLDKLSKKFQITYYDQRASGRSAISNSDEISLQSFTDDIDAIRKHLGQDKIYLLAHSWGAIPAINYGIQHPDHVKGIIFCNPIPFNKEFDAEMTVTQQSRLVGADSTDRSIIKGSPNFKAGRPSAYKKLLILSFRNSFYKKANFPKFNVEMPDNYKEASQALYRGLGNELSEYDYYENIKNFLFPVMILHGAADAIPLRASERIIEFLPTATLEVFKKSGHFIFIEENRKFNRVVSKFISH
ncbi:MAG: alpha/beta fold hydrolase [Cyclobacteriaceae bacterium]|nr:alpha/beta fold hydrolase [Cyclobacteriaceae bacterium]